MFARFDLLQFTGQSKVMSGYKMSLPLVVSPSASCGTSASHTATEDIVKFLPEPPGRDGLIATKLLTHGVEQEQIDYGKRKRTTYL